MTEGDGTRKSMRSNRRRDTKPELLLRSELHRRGLRYRVDIRVPVEGGYARPDVVFTGRKIAVFIDGCFWHSCPEHRSVPAGETADFWARKLQATRERDERDTELLKAAGWKVVRVWEHETVLDAADRVEATLASAAEKSPLVADVSCR